MLQTRWLTLFLLLGACAHQSSSAPVTIAGTQWRFPAQPVVGERVVTFLADGTTKFSGLETGGHWKQDGDQLVFDSNDFTEYRVVIEGTRMSGEWKRLKGDDKGHTSPTSLERL